MCVDSGPIKNIFCVGMTEHSNWKNNFTKTSDALATAALLCNVWWSSGITKLFIASVKSVKCCSCSVWAWKFGCCCCLARVAGEDALPGNSLGLGEVTEDGGYGFENFRETRSWLPQLELVVAAKACSCCDESFVSEWPTDRFQIW